jgi:hypothetical protein
MDLTDRQWPVLERLFRPRRRPGRIPIPAPGRCRSCWARATDGANHADIAASHGERFRYSGYTASLSSLPTGTNYFGTAAHSPHTNTWT